ncbi:hypothetical protein CCM_04472 [Cordyceps militaris CM01]|uniref:Uncharacterized protein n=1 Tax=Cordyceps militaris (strain CM01) TaxID=983644 RepID=G3JF44_CORMM|nr:uncharacterized protein CCM_04472 [Cordyceps militaris CM01]EGX93100.1 hypothetical protein CCM_04472 [Cordyceps militaris CM01]
MGCRMGTIAHLFVVVLDTDADILLATPRRGVRMRDRKGAAVLGDVGELVRLAALDAGAGAGAGPATLAVAVGAVGVLGVLGAVVLCLAQADGGEEGQRRDHVADVELDDAPDDEHGGVVVAELDAVDLRVAQDGAERGEEAEREDGDEAQLLLEPDVELEQDRDGEHGDEHVRDDGEHGVGGKRGDGGQAGARFGGVPRLVNLDMAHVSQKLLFKASISSYRIAVKDEGEGAAQVIEKDKRNGGPDDDAVCAIVGALQQAQVADEQGNLEEADADLVDGAAGVVDARVGDEVLLGPLGGHQAEAVLGLDDAEDRVSNGEDEGEDAHPVVGGDAIVLLANEDARADDDCGQPGHDDAHGDDHLVLGLRIELRRAVGDEDHGGGGGGRCVAPGRGKLFGVCPREVGGGIV